MKVLHVINSLATGGAEKLLVESVSLYQSKGIATDVLLLDGTNHPFYNDFKLKNKGQLFSLGTNSVYNPMHIFKIIPYLKKYDIVHVHLFPALYWVALAKWLGFSKSRIIFTEHSTHNRRRNNWILQKTDRFIYSKYDALVGITTAVNEKLKNHLKLEQEKFHLIENGIDLTKITDAKAYEKAQLQLPADCFLLLQVSSFRYPKDQATVIRSLQQLPDHVHLILVGEGPTQSEAKAIAKESNVAHRVHFLDVRLDVPQLLKTADVVILSSEYEGLSLSSIEGMASGKPFVASDVPGLNEMVSGVGILFPLREEKKLAEIIGKLLNDAVKREEVARNCQSKAQQFDSNTMVEKYIKLYQHIVNG